MSLRNRPGGVIGGIGGGWLRTFHHLAPDRKDPTSKTQPWPGESLILFMLAPISPRGDSLRVNFPTAASH